MAVSSTPSSHRSWLWRRSHWPRRKSIEAGLVSAAAVLCLSLVAAARPYVSDAPTAPRTDSAKGELLGDVTPARTAELGAKGKAAHKALVTFIGYRRLAAETDQVYVELTDSAEVDATRTGRTLEFTIRNAKVTRRNNKNPLIASQFDSIVESARLVQSGKSVRLVIRLRAAAEPQHRVVPRSGGATLEVNLTRKSGPLPPDDEPKKKRKKKSSKTAPKEQP